MKRSRNFSSNISAPLTGGENRDNHAATAADLDSTKADAVSASADVEATGRDDAAADREIISTARDLAAVARDRAAEEFEFAQGPGGPEYEAAVLKAAEVRTQAAGDRALAAADRREAAEDREEATLDRQRAIKDREHAAMDREHAAMDRQQAMIELERAHTDDLTGAFRRGAGRIALQSEIDRAVRSGTNLVLAFVDVNGLKGTNDQLGHTAGDARLRDTVTAMRSRTRSYEPIVRFGGDEFLCTFSGVSVGDVEKRFEEIDSDLRTSDDLPYLSVGLAELEPEETLQALIDRADKAMIKTRHI